MCRGGVMTDEEHEDRAIDIVFLLVYKDMDLETVWRIVCPEADCTAASARRMVQREIEWLGWYSERRYGPGLLPPYDRELFLARIRMHKRNSRPVAEPAQKVRRRCLGCPTKRRCRKRLPAGTRKQRCQACATEHRRVQRIGYNQNNHLRHKEEHNEKRRQRYWPRRRSEILAEVEAVIRAEYEKRRVQLQGDYGASPAMTDVESLRMPSGKTIGECLGRLDPQAARRTSREIVEKVKRENAATNGRRTRQQNLSGRHWFARGYTLG